MPTLLNPRSPWFNAYAMFELVLDVEPGLHSKHNEQRDKEPRYQTP